MGNKTCRYSSAPRNKLCHRLPTNSNMYERKEGWIDRLTDEWVNSQVDTFEDIGKQTNTSTHARVCTLRKGNKEADKNNLDVEAASMQNRLPGWRVIPVLVKNCVSAEGDLSVRLARKKRKESMTSRQKKLILRMIATRLASAGDA